VAGDTRFDRVYAITQNAPLLPLVQEFAHENTVIVAGSTWEPDEILLINFIQKAPAWVKLIIAPHETTPKNIERLTRQLNVGYICHSKADMANVQNARVLIIDSIGILSGVYKYGHLAYIGGGFGKGIHNTLEAATFGMPVVFGPNYQRFNEACRLIEKNAAFSISSQQTLEQTFDKLLNNPSFCIECGENAARFVEEMRGGTQQIIEKLTL
jgi:3-deoxy-D-manno-octulosonic-acid transferase